MPRYIDAELLDPEDFENCTPYQAREIINSIPTADVAPKSEVAREIFAEIETSLMIESFHGGDVYYAIQAEDYLHYKKKYEEGEPNGKDIKE